MIYIAYKISTNEEGREIELRTYRFKHISKVNCCNLSVIDKLASNIKQKMN